MIGAFYGPLTRYIVHPGHQYNDRINQWLVLFVHTQLSVVVAGHTVNANTLRYKVAQRTYWTFINFLTSARISRGCMSGCTSLMIGLRPRSSGGNRCRRLRAGISRPPRATDGNGRYAYLEQCCKVLLSPAVREAVIASSSVCSATVGSRANCRRQIRYTHLPTGCKLAPKEVHPRQVEHSVLAQSPVTMYDSDESVPRSSTRDAYSSLPSWNFCSKNRLRPSLATLLSPVVNPFMKLAVGKRGKATRSG